MQSGAVALSNRGQLPPMWRETPRPVPRAANDARAMPSAAPVRLYAVGGGPGILPAQAPRGRVVTDVRQDVYLDHPGQGLTPARIVSILRDAENGWTQTQCDLISDLVETDASLRSWLEQRRHCVAGKDWILQADDPTSEEEVLAAQVLGDLLFRLPMVGVFDHQLTFNQYGWGAANMEWGIRRLANRDWIAPIWFHPVEARRFKVDPKTNTLRYLTGRQFDKNASEPLRPAEWLVTTRDDGPLARASLMRTGVWFAYFKRATFGDGFVYAQKYGFPIALVLYDPKATDNAKDIAEEIARNIGNEGAAAVPKGIEVDIEEAGRAGDGTPLSRLISDCNRELNILINGSTLSTDVNENGTGSYAHANVHAEVRFENVVYDAERLQEAFRTQVAAPFFHFNGIKGNPSILKFRIARQLDPVTRGNVADIYVNKLGGTVSDTQMRQEFGFVEPTGTDDELKGEAAKRAESAPTPAPVAAGGVA